MMNAIDLVAQTMPVISVLPALPVTEGLAGMYGGVSKGNLFCLGGARFPDKKPWEGGKKKWYNDIYMLETGKQWIRLEQKMAVPLAYGVSVSYKDEFITIGGSDDQQNIAFVTSYKWDGTNLNSSVLPELPVPLANMAGAVVGSLAIVTGGNTNNSPGALNICLALDLENRQAGWFELSQWPGRERILPVVAVSNGVFYLFSGETTDLNDLQEKKRKILQDAYSFTPVKINGKWTAKWSTLSTLPKGFCAAGSPAPVLDNGAILFWGGVDATTALHTNPATHPGISPEVYLFYPEKDKWAFAGKMTEQVARVTLPVIYWNHQWIYISGEIKAAVRTNSVLAIINE